MLGNPIFGGGYMKQASSKSGSRRQRDQSAAPPAQVRKPGLFARRDEKDLYKGALNSDPALLKQVGEQSTRARPLAWSLAGLMLLKDDPQTARRLLNDVFAEGSEPAEHPFAAKYGIAADLKLTLTPGIDAELPLSRDAVGLALAELLQENDDLDIAVDTVEQLEPTSYAAVSLAELYSQADRHQDVADLTENIDNQDDLTALLLVYRGIALRELGYPDASLEALRDALRARSRDQEIRHLAYSERATTYEGLGKKAMARKDLERILAKDSRYEGVKERLEELAS